MTGVVAIFGGRSEIGLAIARRIVEAHGGTLALAAREGWTTCFRITLPSEPRAPAPGETA